MHQNVGKLKISVHDFILYQSFEGIKNLNEELNSFLLIEGFFLFEIN